MLPILALISGEGLLNMLVYIIVLGLIFYLLFWLIGYVALPAPFDKVAKVILAVAAVVMLISVLLGRPIVAW